MTLPEFIPDGLEPPQLDQLCRQLSNEVHRLGKIVGGYEVDFMDKTKAYKKELARAIFMNREYKVATIIKAAAEQDPAVIAAEDALQVAEALLITGKAELEGRDKQYQGIKKIMDLKIQEIRVFRG